jgi:hypothetical protein
VEKLPMYLTPKQLRETLVDWSDDTLRNKIESEGFPAIQTGIGPRPRFLIPRDEAILWFKRRTVKTS